MTRPRAQFCKHGHNTSVCGRDKRNACKQCKLDWQAKHPEYFPKYFEENKEELLKQMKQYYVDNRDLVLALNKQWRDAHKEEKALSDKEYYELHKEDILARNRQWQKEHPEVMKTLKIKTQTNRNLRVVAWTDWNEIEQVYKNCPKGMVVDHIIPLQGKNVSGLHVSWNLQYLTPEENNRKHNRVDLTKI